MTKKLFFLIFSCFFLILNFRILTFFPVLALEPAIINDAILGPPPIQGTYKNDINYHSNDILNTTTVTCPGTGQISQTIQPIQTGTTDSNGDPNYVHQTITSIQGTLTFDHFYSNTAVRNSLIYAGNQPKTLIGDPDTIHREFLSFDANRGASNMVNRSTPYSVLKCQKSQRLIYAILSLNPAANLTYHNEHVAWDCPDRIYSITEKSDGSGCTQIRLSDIAATLASDLIFYPVNIDCAGPSLPDPVTLPYTVPHPHPLPHTTAQQLLNTAVQVIDNGSNARGLSVCDTDASGNPVNCPPPPPPQIPYGNNQATVKQTAGLLVSHTQTITNYDPCLTTSQPTSPDRPNPVSFFAKVIGLATAVYKDAVNIIHPVTKTYSFDQRVVDGANVQYTSQNNLIPYSEQQKYQTNSPNGSSLNPDQSIDPGKPSILKTFANDLQPRPTSTSN
jgi:hypothetical protein